MLGDIEWGGWESEAGENPNDCLRTDTFNGVPVVSNLSDTLDETAPVEVTTEYGAESFDADSIRKVGDPVGNGSVSLFVTSNLGTRPLTITAPAV